MIQTSEDGDCLMLTIDRPEKVNALTPNMLKVISKMVETATTKVLILNGRGRVFSSGADLVAARAELAVRPLWERLSKTVANFSGITIAVINGTVAGGAMGMVLACDLRISVAEANFLSGHAAGVFAATK